MFDIQNLIGQLSNSSNPISMVLGMLPNQGLKNSFTSIANSNNDEERAQKIADFCNARGITKEQLASILKQKRF